MKRTAGRSAGVQDERGGSLAKQAMFVFEKHFDFPVRCHCMVTLVISYLSNNFNGHVQEEEAELDEPEEEIQDMPAAPPQGMGRGRGKPIPHWCEGKEAV